MNTDDPSAVSPISSTDYDSENDDNSVIMQDDADNDTDESFVTGGTCIIFCSSFNFNIVIGTFNFDDGSDCFPFPSKISALMYLLLHNPRPIVNNHYSSKCILIGIGREKLEVYMDGYTVQS